jgi:outer membrane lipoprotein
MARRSFISSIVVLLLLLATTGCAPVISRSVLDSLEPGITFEDIMKAPAAREGAMVLLGGRVLGVENLPDVTLVEVLEYPLGRNLRPLPSRASGGRFLVRYRGFLDPLVYTGRLITVAGTLREPIMRPLGKRSYVYPVLDVMELYRWRIGQEAVPAISIGIGLGFSTGD